MKWLMTFALILGSTAVQADSDGLTALSHPKWKEECGSCHIAYPPQLLTAGDWGRMMDGLDKHFGVNAGMDAKDAADILAFLQGHAGKGKRYSAPSMRISDTAWFKREHREVGSWSDKAVKSASNCTACHVNAERGDWSEDSVRMPGGMQKHDDDD